MTECPQHHLQYTSIVTSINLPICPQCPEYLQQQIQFGSSLSEIRSSLIHLEEFILSEMVLVNLEGLRQNAKTEYQSDLIGEEAPVFSDLQTLSQMESQFWQLPEAQIISEDSKVINWAVLRKYGVIGQKIEIERVISIKDFLTTRLNELKKTAKKIETQIKQKKNQRKSKNRETLQRERESQKFEIVIEDISSGEDAEDLEAIGVPEGVKLDESNKEIVKLLEEKKIGLNERVEREEKGIEDGRERQEPVEVNMKKAKKKIGIKQENQVDQPINNDQKQQKVEPFQKEINEGKQQQKEKQIQVHTQIQPQVKDQKQFQNPQEDKSNDYTETQNLFTMVVKLQYLIEKKQFQNALEAIQKILQLSPQNIFAIQTKAKLLFINNQKGKSFDIYKRIVDDKQSDPSVIYQTAVLYLQKQNYTQTKALIEKLFKLDPIKEQYYALKGDYLLRFYSNQKIFFSKVIHNPKQIFECYTHAYNLSKKDSKYIFKLVIYHINQKQYESGYQLMKQALEQDPQNINYLKCQAWLSLKLSKFGESITHYKTISMRNPTAEILNGYAVAFYFNNQFELSMEKILEAYEKNSYLQAIILNALTISKQVANYKQGFDIVKKSFNLLKSNELFVSKACQMAIYQNNNQQSQTLLAELTKLRKIDINVSKQFYIAYYSLGLFLKNEDVINDGLQFLTNFLSEHVSENEKRQVWNMLGMLKVYKKESGYEEFKKAIICSSEQQYKHAHFWNCSVAAYKNKMYKEARDLIQKAIVLEKKGKKAKYFEFRVCVAIKQLDFEAALSFLEQFKTDFPKQITEETYVKLKASLNKSMDE